MAYRTPAEISRDIGNSFALAADRYDKMKAQEQEKEYYNTIVDPNASDSKKSKAFAGLKDTAGFLKWDKGRRERSLVDQLRGLETGQPGGDTTQNPDLNDTARTGISFNTPQGKSPPKERQLGGGGGAYFDNPTEQPATTRAAGAMGMEGLQKVIPEAPRSSFSDQFQTPAPAQRSNVGQQPDLSAAKRQALINELGVSNAPLANLFQTREGQRQKGELAEKKFEQKERELATKEKENREKQILPIQQEAAKSLEANREQDFALQNQLTAIENDDVGVWSKANLAEWLKDAGYQRLAEAATTEGAALFKTSGKQIFTGAKEIFPGRVTNFDAGIFQEMMAAIGRDKQANKIAVETLRHPVQIKIERNKFILDTIRDNPEISPIELNTAVYNHMEQFRDNLYQQWHQKLEDWQLKQQPRRQSSVFSAGPTQTQEQKQRRSLSEILK